MDEPRVRRPFSFEVLMLLVLLGLGLGWLAAIGLIVRTVNAEHLALQFEVGALGHHVAGTGTHEVAAGESAGAQLITERYELRLFDVSPLAFYGVRVLDILIWLAELLALHQLNRILRRIQFDQPFSPINARRCGRIGLFLLGGWLLMVTRTLVQDQLVAATHIDGLHRMSMWSIPYVDLTTLLLAFVGFGAAIVLHYGAALERERALTI